MYSDEGPSNRIPILSEERPREDAGQAGTYFLPSQTPPAPLAGASNLVEDPSGSSVSAPNCRPLSLFDKYKIISGVPAFVFGPVRSAQSAQPILAISNDGKLMALATDDVAICVYDMRSNFSLLAESRVVTKSRILYLSFLNHKNNKELIAISENRSIISVILSKKQNGIDSKVPRIECKYELVRKNETVFDDDEEDGERIDPRFMSVSIVGSKLWMFEWKRKHRVGLWIVRLSARGLERSKGKNEFLKALTDICCPHTGNVIMVMKLFHEPRFNQTAILNLVDFPDDPQTAHLVDVKGKGVSWSEDGRYFLVWTRHEDHKNSLNLYSRDIINSTSEEENDPTVSTFLGFYISDVKAQCVDRSLLEYCGHGRERSTKNMPLFALLVFRSGQVVLTVWDSFSNQFLKEINLTIKEITLSSVSEFQFAISPNMKWVAVAFVKDSIVALYCMQSGVLVWQTGVCLPKHCGMDGLCLQFDAFGSKLLVKGLQELHVFMPSCLIDGYLLEFHIAQCDSFLACGTLLSKSKELQRAIPKHVLWRLALQHFIQLSREFVDIANSVSSSEMSLVFFSKKQLWIYYDSFEKILSKKFESFVKARLRGQITQPIFPEIKIDWQLSTPFKEASNLDLFLYMYPNELRNEESLVLLNRKYGIQALFIDLNAPNASLDLQLSETRVYYFAQTKDGSKVTCLGRDRIEVIKLNSNCVIQTHMFQIDLPSVVYKYCRESRFAHFQKNIMKSTTFVESPTFFDIIARSFSFLEIHDSGDTLLLGWDSRNKQVLVLTTDTQDHELQAMEAKNIKIDPCWSVSKDFKKVCFVEFDENQRKIVAIGTYNVKGSILQRFDISEWNPSLQSALLDIDATTLNSFSITFNESNGCLWLALLRRDVNRMRKLTLVPFHPYLMKKCVSCLYIRNHDKKSAEIDHLDKLVEEYGSSLFNMTFNGMTNLHFCVWHKDATTLNNLANIAKQRKIQIGLSVGGMQSNRPHQNILCFALEQKVSHLTRSIFNLVEKQIPPFEDCAQTLNWTFQDLWQSNQKLFEAILLQDVLVWECSSLQVPLEIFTNKKFRHALVGTCAIGALWETELPRKEAIDMWKDSNKEVFKSIEEKGNPTMVSAVVKLVCIKNVCHTGLHGIMRFLLKRRVPSYIFSSNIVKWVTMWKWEHLWKKRAMKDSIRYIIFLFLFNAYTLCFGIMGRQDKDGENPTIVSSCILFSLMMVTLWFLSSEYLKLQTYQRDGKTLFTNKPFWGVVHYFRSKWNCVELIICLSLLFVIVPLHVHTIVSRSTMEYLCVSVAITSVLVWMKAWYYAQTFKPTGYLVLLIENVVKDSIFFILLALVVLVGYSVALHVMFQTWLGSHNQEPTKNNNGRFEEYEKIQDQFANPLKTMITLFFAMLGNFDTEIFLPRDELSAFIATTFVLFLFTQMIVILNMLIAIMCDTFDRVKSTEEEHLIMGRATFIDACEATLSKNEVNQIEQNIGKYLYVILPKDKGPTESFQPWYGRVNNIKRSMKHMIDNSQNEIVERLDESAKKHEERLKDMKKELEDLMNAHAKGLEDKMRNEMNRLEATVEDILMSQSEAMDYMDIDQ